jgi:hypothetical protein
VRNIVKLMGPGASFIIISRYSSSVPSYGRNRNYTWSRSPKNVSNMVKFMGPGVQCHLYGRERNLYLEPFTKKREEHGEVDGPGHSLPSYGRERN